MEEVRGKERMEEVGGRIDGGRKRGWRVKGMVMGGRGGGMEDGTK